MINQDHKDCPMRRRETTIGKALKAFIFENDRKENSTHCEMSRIETDDTVLDIPGLIYLLRGLVKQCK